MIKQICKQLYGNDLARLCVLCLHDLAIAAVAYWAQQLIVIGQVAPKFVDAIRVLSLYSFEASLFMMF